MKVELTGKTAVVTGGGGVLCSCMARQLAACGANVVVMSRKQHKADKVAEEIVAAGGNAISLACDVLDKDGLEDSLKAAHDAYGDIDILINGAGGNHPDGTTSKEYFEQSDLEGLDEGLKSFFELKASGIEHVFNLNFLGTLLPAQVFCRGMAARGSGVVINISSMSAFAPLTKIPAYSAAKAAVNNFTQWMAVHFSRVGIRVNAIAPGFFVSEQNRALLMNDDGSLTARGQKIIDQTPLGRFGEPEELLGTLLWLASDEASGFVSGAVIPVDGAFAAYSGV